jgi:predicted nucleotidyltransferase
MSKEHPYIPKDLIEDSCRRNHMRKLSIFGSYLRDEVVAQAEEVQHVEG